MEFGDKLKLIRINRNLTGEGLSKLIGLNPTNIRRYEVNDRTPKLEQIDKIAAALNVSPNALLEDDSHLRMETVGDLFGLLITLIKLGVLEIDAQPDEKGVRPPLYCKFSFSPVFKTIFDVDDDTIEFQIKDLNQLMINWYTAYVFSKAYSKNEERLTPLMRDELEHWRKKEAEEALRLQCIDTPLSTLIEAE